MACTSTTIVQTSMTPVVLVCRSIEGRHELWSLSGTQDNAPYFKYIGSVTRPQDYQNRVIVQ